MPERAQSCVAKPQMILPTILWTFKGKLLLGLSALFTTFAVSEVIMGHLIAAIAPTLMVGIALVTLMRGQKQMLITLDGKLEELVNAKVAAGRAEGKEQERVESRVRQGEAALAKELSGPSPVIVENTKDNPAHVKPVE